MYIDKIPGLSEKFIYGNDDMFLNRLLSPDDFFTREGKPIVWLSRRKTKKISISVAKRMLADTSLFDWEKTVVRAWSTYLEHGGVLPFYSPAHSFDAYTKKIYRYTKEKYPALLRINSSPFRTGAEIARNIFSYEMISTFQCPVVFNERRKLWQRLLGRNLNSQKVNIKKSNMTDLAASIYEYNPKAFCIQTINNDNYLDVIEYLERRFPVPAPWERS